MPVLKAFYEKWGEKGLVVLAVNIGESKDVVAKFAAERGLPFTVLLDTSGKASSVYRVQYLPTAYFVDPNGVVRDKVIGAFSSLSQIESRLSKIMP